MSILDVILTITFFTSLFVKSNLKYYGIFLGVYWIVEVFLAPWSAYRTGSNILVYNVFVLFTVLYYLMIFSKSKKEYLILSILYLCGWIISVLNVSIFSSVASKNYAFGLIMVAVLIVREFKLKLQVDYVDHFFADSKFWFGLGILLFLSCSFPILVFADFLIVSSESAHKIYRYLLKVGNILLHLGYLMVLISETRWMKLHG